MPDPIGGRSQTMADPNLAEIWRRSRNSVRRDRYWIITLDGTRLREARIERGLSRDELAEEAGVSLATVGWLERQHVASCHRATLYRIAEVLADDPEPVVAALVIDDGAVEAAGPPSPGLGAPAA